ncbi:MAG: DUF423 domain-containing protein [Flammeovirgaceae bacterium]|nr:DUF423 domain-containing protein [Flammeovirgaceae bacterium]
MNKKQTLIAGASLGFLSVMVGAFGAHALKPLLSELGRTETFELAVRYQMYHAFALLVAGFSFNFFEEKYLKLSAISFLLGIILFSGSLYLLCFISMKAFALLTPVGGVFLLAGWALLLITFIQNKKPS